jgi:hypothetical protein
VPVIQEMVNAFYDRTDLLVEENPTLHEKWSPAEVNQILFRNFDTPEKALQDLAAIQPLQFQE